ncbi:MAG: hypothetical protein KJ919_01755 [Verrucomicrobia bacterium]|nr:hypothetical protein [Verrucomicrobiota bacterium]
MKTLMFTNDTLKLGIGEDATLQLFADQQDDRNYAATSPRAVFAAIRQGDRTIPASAARRTDDGLALTFAPASVEVALRVRNAGRYFVIEVAEVRGDEVEELVFVDAPLTLNGSLDEPFAACALALNLATRVPGLPGLSHALQAICCRRFGLVGAKTAIIGCATQKLRTVIQEVVRAADDLPKSALGGPWAEDAPVNRGSYLFNFGGVTEQTVADWINLMRKLGFTQLDFHGGTSFRFGDLEPNPEMYPRGLDSLKAVNDRLHEAGMIAGLHTYAFFIDKRCKWVTPKPHPELGKDATFTLAAPLAADADAVPVLESTAEMSTVTGFFVRNSVTIQIDNELITYAGIKKDQPCAFTQCNRGACGTHATSPMSGAKVHHLKECFGLFTPEGDSALLTEVAACTADVFNYCGFDMIYLDALDGEDILGGAEYGWHYGSKFVFELNKRLPKPALMEMSTFHHHLWYVRSRLGAWDHPTRAHKQFIDNHVAANQDARRIFLPSVLGWWALLFGSGPNEEPTYSDDIEYLCAKALGTDSALALMRIDPGSYADNPGVKRMGNIVGHYERLRLSRAVPETIRARLREPGHDFTLVESGEGRWVFRPAHYTKHKIADADGTDRRWTIENPHAPQPLRLRIEALLSAQPYDAVNSILTGFDEIESRNAQGVSAQYARAPDEPALLSFRARNDSAAVEKAWCCLRRVFTPPRNMMAEEKARTHVAAQGQAQLEGMRQTVGMGLWVLGDGNGQTINIRLNSPAAVTSAIADHYVTVDFKGWRYFELIEPEAERVRDYIWPKESAQASWIINDEDHAVLGQYAIYRESVDFTRIESVRLWYHHLPAGREACCLFKPIKILPLVSAVLRCPTVRVGDAEIGFPVELESGQYLEFDGTGPANVYGRDGALIVRVEPQGPVPLLRAGRNEMGFTCEPSRPVTPRARVTVISLGNNLE